ncbi:MAG: PRTRC system ParB family protein [Burkholderiaceae bacterium]|nr:PRTRC system ParB family protein [Burkholderiaceae bacterium]
METPTIPTLPLRRILQGENPREYFDPDDMAELEDGLRAAGGVIQPIIVRPILDSDRYEIVAGERRWRAAKNVFGDDYDMPVVIRALSDAQAESFATIENHHRAAMSHAEEAHAAKRMLMRVKGDKDETAAALGWKPELLERRLALLTCTPAVLKALTHRKIQLGHAELLAGVPPEKQDGVLDAIIERRVPVAVLKAQLGRFARRLADAIFDTAPCAMCTHNSARQSGLFDESLGDGYCQHPTHYDELTMLAVQARADGLRDEFPVVRIVKVGDGFTPLPVAADGDLGVGAPQYRSCLGCHSFGCAVSALPGSYGEVTRSLCFDPACNSQKVALRRKAQREAGQTSASDEKGKGTASGTGKPVMKKAGAKPANQTPQRVISHRVAEWRKWAAQALMAQPQRNQRVLIALTRYGRVGDARAIEYGAAMRRIASGWVSESGWGLASHLSQADQLAPEHLDRLVRAVAASAAFGVGERDLLDLLNYLEVDEARYFKWDKIFLELFTMSELESLAVEVGLKEAMGSRFKVARARRKPEFIAALLEVDGFAYHGTVPVAMRYPRHPVGAALGCDEAGSAEAEPQTLDAEATQPI